MKQLFCHSNVIRLAVFFCSLQGIITSLLSLFLMQLKIRVAFDFISSLHDSVIAHPGTGVEIDSAVKGVKEEDGET